MLTKWIIVVAFGVSSAQSGDPSIFTRTDFGQRLHTQAITDDQGQVVVFDNIDACAMVAKAVLKTMEQDVNVVPKYVQCTAIGDK